MTQLLIFARQIKNKTFILVITTKVIVKGQFLFSPLVVMPNFKSLYEFKPVKFFAPWAMSKIVD